MRNYQENPFRVVVILLMLSTAPLAVTYSYADSGERSDQEKTRKDHKFAKSSQESLSSLYSKDLENDRTYGEIPKWTFVNYQGYQTGIVLFDGKSSDDRSEIWSISVNGSLNLTKGELNLEVVGKPNNSISDKAEDLPKKDLDYRIIFSGNLTESDEKNQFLIAFLNSTLENSEKNRDYQLLQILSPSSESINPVDGKQQGKNPVWAL